MLYWHCHKKIETRKAITLLTSLQWQSKVINATFSFEQDGETAQATITSLTSHNAQEDISIVADNHRGVVYKICHPVSSKEVSCFFPC